jgi:LmbE family N-acetylglucosaminyl deacetylase
MPPKKNPLNLNPLQLKTLTLLQALAQLPEICSSGEEPGSVVINVLPSPHGDHFHLGDAVVAARDATGLSNPSVWAALVRKGLVRPGDAPGSALLTPLGLRYETGLADAILHRAAH